MKTIGIADFKELVMERLANPSLFAGRSLLLWNEHYMYDGSISYNVMRQCCIEHNEANPDKQAWIKYSDTLFYSDNITEILKYERNIGTFTRGILYNTGCFFPYKYIDKWLKFINTHVNDTGNLSADWSLIACVQANSPHYNITEGDFADNCDIYELKPTIEEWAQWLLEGDMGSNIICEVNALSSVLKYIDKNGLTISYYWWNIILNKVSWLLIKNDYETIDQIPDGELEDAIKGEMVYNLTGRYLTLEEREDIGKFLRSYCISPILMRLLNLQRYKIT